MKIGAALMVRNMEWCVGAAISCLEWVDAIYLLDDHSSDATTELAKAHSAVRVTVERSPFDRIAFVEGECGVRNYMLERAFATTGADVLVLLDGDEILSSEVRPQIERAFASGADSIYLSTFHLFDLASYLHFWETKIDGMLLIDPHMRVVSRQKRYVPLFASGAHPIIPSTAATACVTEPLHFHLKYFHCSGQANYSLTFLPKWLDRDTVAPLLRQLPSPLPPSIVSAIGKVRWPSRRTDSDYYRHFKIKRVHFGDLGQALIHPRDLPDRSLYGE